jgi:putative Mg2+ transporter-C (MgtC) family protein
MDLITTPASLPDLAMRLGFAALLGAVLGLNRELRHKPAGLRTHALVALGAALATLLSIQAPVPGGATDLTAFSRVLQGLLAGVGFIGGGVILHRDDSTKGVHGLTTAASIWLVAALGAAAGAGLWRTATVALILALAVLAFGGPVERLAKRWFGHGPDEDPAHEGSGLGGVRDRT